MIRDLADGNRRFCELERSLDGISPRTLSLRLRALEECGVVERHTYPEVPPRVEYALTEKGRALSPLIDDMREYGARWLGVGERRRTEREPPVDRLRRSPRWTGSLKRKESCRRGGPPAPGEDRLVRDLHLRHTLTSLARDASEVFDDLVEGGQEIPYEIGEAGEGFAFCQYQPLTARFVRDNATELRELESFREATETMRRSEHRRPLPRGGRDHARRPTPSSAPTSRSPTSWPASGTGPPTSSSTTSASPSTVAEIEECAEPEAGEVEAIVPLVGFQMPPTRLDLSGAAIVRADAVDVPAEAARGERPGGAAWEPTFLISARVSLDDDGGLGGAGDRVARTFERVVTTLRLYKPGGVGLGPHGWVRVAGDRWRRIATGAGQAAPGRLPPDRERLLERHRPLPDRRRASAPDLPAAPRAAALRGRPRPPRRRRRAQRPPARAALPARGRGPGRSRAADARGRARRGTATTASDAKERRRAGDLARA